MHQQTLIVKVSYSNYEAKTAENYAFLACETGCLYLSNMIYTSFYS